jgi:prophage regulatory protein
MKSSRPERGFRRLKWIIKPQGPIPVSRSVWWAGVRSKWFSTPVKLGPRITAWLEEDLRKLIEEGIPRAGLAALSGDRL